MGVALAAVADHGDLAGEQAEVAVAEESSPWFELLSFSDDRWEDVLPGA